MNYLPIFHGTFDCLIGNIWRVCRATAQVTQNIIQKRYSPIVCEHVQKLYGRTVCTVIVFGKVLYIGELLVNFATEISCTNVHTLIS
jgi:hypothetical protein